MDGVVTAELSLQIKTWVNNLNNPMTDFADVGTKNVHCGGSSHRRGKPMIQSFSTYSDGDTRQYSWARAMLDMEP